MAERQFLLIEVGGERFAVLSSQVRAVSQYTHRVSNAPSVDLAAVLGLSRGHSAPGYELAVMTPAGEAAFAIDKALDVAAIQDSQLLSLPEMARAPAAERGITQALILQDKVLLVLDLIAVGDQLSAGQRQARAQN